ncbi:MAG: iron ABC transporter permease [Gammaproteobacteria bacterium]|nr:iron ABC transporter permease [Gammaproteobacteria bacterium]
MNGTLSSGSWFWRCLAFLAAAIVAFPILIILSQWGTVGSGEQEIWQHLFDTKLDRLALNTLMLVLGVGLGVILLGVSLAWLTTICEFPGRRLFEWALMLPLAVPGYVMAFVFLGIMNYAGPIQTAMRKFFGQDAWFPDVQGTAGVIFILSLVLYPYVYMLSRSAFLNQGRQLMDAGRLLGLSRLQAFFRVAIPVARPAIVAGLALALMETLADFGAVSVFSYDTFTTAIYDVWNGLFNLTVAAQLASLLLLFVAVTLVLEKQSRDRARYTQDNHTSQIATYQLIGFKAIAATGYCALVLFIGFIVPLGQLVLWMLKSGFGALDERYLGYLGHTVLLGVMAGALVLVIALLLAFVKRLPGTAVSKSATSFSIRLATLGYALPGSVLAVGIILGFTYVDRSLGTLLSSSVIALLIAYCCRFLAVAYAPVDAGLEQVKPSVIDAARALGAKPGRVLRQIIIPLLKPGLLTGFTIVLVDVMKEMPATLIMRPFGWDTLAVRIYTMTAEGQWETAALPAVTLIIVGLLPVYLLIRSARSSTSRI